MLSVLATFHLFCFIYCVSILYTDDIKQATIIPYTRVVPEKRGHFRYFVKYVIKQIRKRHLIGAKN